MNEALFARIDALHRQRDSLGLTAEQRARARAPSHQSSAARARRSIAEKKKRLAAITERLAALGTAFSQNVLADEQSYTLVLDGEADLAGLPDFVREAASAAAAERGMPGKHVITLQRSSVEPFLQFSSRRDLREKAFRAWLAPRRQRRQVRQQGDHRRDHRAARRARQAARLSDLRALPARRRHGEDAGGGARAAGKGLGAGARARARRPRRHAGARSREEGGNFTLAPWDWRYYAEKLRKRRCDLEEAEVKPYMQLDHVIEAAFYAANKLFGLTFKPVDVPVWHPDVRAWEVRGADGGHVGLFFGDYFARPSKQSGGWMGTLRDQEKLSGKTCGRSCST